MSAHFVSVLLLAAWTCLPLHAQTKATPQGKPSPPAVPLYDIRFQVGEPVPGASASPVIFLPFQCTSGGTVFVEMAGANNDYASRLLTSFSLAGEAHVFRLEQATGLYDVANVSHYVTDAGVIFLVEAATEDKQGKMVAISPSGERHELARNVAEHHLYVLSFDREGRYQRKVEIDDDTLHVQQIGMFPSGMFLAYGFDRVTHTPRLAMLNDDGTTLKYLQVPDVDVPESALHTRDASRKGPADVLSLIQLAPERDSIIVVQSNSKFPLLEVSEAGTIRAIRLKLAGGEMVDMLIPSDEGLYASVGLGVEQRPTSVHEAIYQINPHDGSVVARFEMSKDDAAGQVACVHDKKFLSFEHGEGKLIPLIGTAELVGGVASSQRDR
jgi:hypothetical protein